MRSQLAELRTVSSAATRTLHDVLAGPVEDAAPSLLGAVLVGRGAAGVVVEVEAYHEREPSCHAHGRDPTPRTRNLFGQPGTAYVYFTYGMHHCANIVCEAEGIAAAVLVRALEPVHGIELMRSRRCAGRRPGARPVSDRDLCAGPARLVQALDLRREDDGRMLIDVAGWPAGTRDDPARAIAELASRDEPRLLPVDALVLAALAVDVDDVAVGTRIGISAARDLPWRWGVASSRYLSRRFAGSSPGAGG